VTQVPRETLAYDTHVLDDETRMEPCHGVAQSPLDEEGHTKKMRSDRDDAKNLECSVSDTWLTLIIAAVCGRLVRSKWAAAQGCRLICGAPSRRDS
jgi:hypothetical protein